eukprot:gene1492-1881_t
MTDFQVIIIATDGGLAGSKLSPIDEALPHALLPVANRPLISYQLELLEKSGFQTNQNAVIMVVHENSQAKIRQYVSEIYKGKIEVDFFVLKEHIGTCEILYRIKDKIKSNFIVLSCNLIVDGTFIQQIIDQHRSNDSSLTVLLKPTPKEDPNSGAKPSSSSKDALFIDYIALDEKKEKLIMMESATEIEDKVIFNKSLLTHFPNLTVYNNLIDSQFYIFSRWVIDLICEDQKNKIPKFYNIKKHLIPYLLSHQIPNSTRQQLPNSAINTSQEVALSMSSSASPYGSFSQFNMQQKKIIKCLVYILDNGYCINVYNIPSYQQVNRDITRGESSYEPYELKGKNNYIDETASVIPTQVGPDCIIGTSTSLGARCSVKKSIIGKHCKIGANVRIENSIIMDHVNVEDQCNINGSIIGNNVYIKKGCVVKDSQVASGFTLDSKEVKNKKIGKELD